MRLVIVRPGRKVFLPLSLARVVPEYARSEVVALGLKIFLRKDSWKSQKIRTSGLWLGAIKRRNPRIVRALKTAPSKSAGVPSKGTGTPQDLPQASDAQSIHENIDQWMKRKEEEFAKFMAAHKKTSDRLTELALQEIEEL